MGDGRKARPFGVTLIALVTLLWVLVTLVQVTAVRPPPTATPEQVEAIRRQVQFIAVWAAVGLAGAAGLFGMRRWGWWIGLVYYVGILVQYAVLILGRQVALNTQGIIPLVFKGGFACLVIWYLLSRDNRAAFFRR